MVQAYAPWRDDPRPISGLLQGIYAFVCITEFSNHNALQSGSEVNHESGHLSDDRPGKA